MKKKNAFTLVEILIVFTIVILLALMMVSIFASKNFFDKGKDSQRKKDLARIKVAFEEYYNDKNCYPQDVANWNIQENCKRSSLISFPYLSPWPCDPNGEPYLIIVDSCNKFRVITNLENKNDEDIPPLWYTRTDVILNGKTVEEVNYGVSSSNIMWFDSYINPMCDTSNCAMRQAGSSEGCDDNSTSCVDSPYGICFYRHESGKCLPECRTPCCGSDCVFN